MDLEEILNFRRAVRVFDPEQALQIDSVKKCIELATLSPNSSNMQLWEFYHITDKTLFPAISKACLGQSAANTASQFVVFVTRQDKHKKHAQTILADDIENIKRNSPLDRQESRIKNRERYYGIVMPLLYTRFFGIVGFFRKLLVGVIGLFRPIVRQVSESDVRTIVDQSCALAAQTFMIAMANEKYDTCPLGGYDSKLIKRILKLPRGAKITMVVACGIRKGNEGITGDRLRLPFDSVYSQIST